MWVWMVLGSGWVGGGNKARKRRGVTLLACLGGLALAWLLRAALPVLCQAPSVLHLTAIDRVKITRLPDYELCISTLWLQSYNTNGYLLGPRYGLSRGMFGIE